MIVWTESFPCSGNTFFRAVLHGVYGVGTYSVYDRPSRLNPRELDRFASIPGARFLKEPLAEMEREDEIFFVKTHEMPFLDNCPAVSIVRDGRDALVSYAHFALQSAGEQHGYSQKAFREVLRDMITSDAYFGGWSRNVAAWLNRDAPTIMVRFEELAESPVRTVISAVEGLGLQLPQVANPAVPSLDRLRALEPWSFPKGRPGSLQKEMDKDLADLFRQHHGEVMERLGYGEGGSRPFAVGRQGFLASDSDRSDERTSQLDALDTVVELKRMCEEKERVIRGLKRGCDERDETIELLSGRLADVEGMTPGQGLRGLPTGWQEISDLDFSTRSLLALKSVLGLMLSRSVNDRLRPRLGKLRHHPPRPLNMSAPYVREALPASAPRISVVTPSFNQAAFIRDTIAGVLDQNYPDLEYIVQDGGSTDGTVEILKSYGDRLTHWESNGDTGQANAVNKGFRATSGEIMAYLNSDDLLTPGALNYVGNFFNRRPDVDVIYGHRILIDESGLEIGRWVLPPHQGGVLRWADFVPQETLFWRRSIWEKIGGGLDESFQFAADWDLMLRFMEAGAKFVRVPRFLGAFRVHADQKTTARINGVGAREMAQLRERCHGRPVPVGEAGIRILPYMALHVIWNMLYELRVFRY